MSANIRVTDHLGRSLTRKLAVLLNNSAPVPNLTPILTIDEDSPLATYDLAGLFTDAEHALDDLTFAVSEETQSDLLSTY